MATKDDGLGLPKPALKSLIDAFKTISETFNDILQAAEEEERTKAKKGNRIAAKPDIGRAGVKAGNGGVTIRSYPRNRRSTGTELGR